MTTNSPNQGVNRNKLERWKADIRRSVDMYNGWFMLFVPSAYRETRIKVTADVEAMTGLILRPDRRNPLNDLLLLLL